MDFWRDTHIQSIARFNIIHSYFKFSACSIWVFSRSSSVDLFSRVFIPELKSNFFRPSGIPTLWYVSDGGLFCYVAGA